MSVSFRILVQLCKRAGRKVEAIGVRVAKYIGDAAEVIAVEEIQRTVQIAKRGSVIILPLQMPERQRKQSRLFRRCKRHKFGIEQETTHGREKDEIL